MTGALLALGVPEWLLPALAQGETLVPFTDIPEGSADAHLTRQELSEVPVIGQTLGPYQVLEKLGAGGMGEVYRARDTRLNRHVAIKALPEAFTLSPDRVVRLEREAQLLAALNHPNIAGIYGLEQSGGAACLVLELVEGHPLSTRLAAGPMPVSEALPVARQIADALDAAHEKGIIHRDLKPANVMLTADGHVKLLDFGLGKAIESEPAGNASHSPTMTVGATQAGMLLGTAAYMSPEQAKGLAADKRADVWAFGCVLFEMLTGRRAFEGDDISETLASVLKSDPDWRLLPTDLPPAIRALVEGCLAKNRRARITGMAAALFAIDGRVALASHAGAAPLPAAPGSRQPGWLRAWPIAAAVLLTAALTSVAWWLSRPAPPPALVARFPLQIEEEILVTSASRPVVDVSRDGRQIVFVGNNQLYLRPLADLSARPIAGTESPSGPMGPVFSPDGTEVAFWSGADRTIKRINVNGGVPVTAGGVVSATFGLDWHESGILVGLGPRGVIRIDDRGAVEQLVTLTGNEVAYGPQLLPGGRHVLMTLAVEEVTSQEVWDKARVVVQTVGSDTRTVLVESGGAARYLPTGHLVYALGGTVFAAPFDVDRMALSGPAVPVIEGVRRGLSGVAQFTVSDSGVLAYLPGPAGTSSAPTALALTNRAGEVEPLPLRPGGYDYPRASPDGMQVAFQLSQAGQSAVWVYSLSGKASMRRLTLTGSNRYPVWSGDSSRIAFQSDRDGDLAVFAQRADGTGATVRLTKPENGEVHVPESWSPDGRHLLFTSTRDLKTTLMVLTLADGQAEPFGGVTSINPTTAAFSTDGRWVTYSANSASSENFVYVQPFPATGEIHQVSKEGENGHHPMWTRDGKELLYVPQVGRLVAVTVSTTPTVTFGDPVSVPRRFTVSNPVTPRPWDIARDGRVLSVYDGSQSVALEIRVALNWFDELRARVPLR